VSDGIYLGCKQRSQKTVKLLLAINKVEATHKSVLIAQDVFKQFTVGPAEGEIVPGPTVQTDEEVARFICQTSVSSAHQARTVAMRPLDDEGVVSPTLEVYGVKGLRVVDNSIVPVLVDQHPTAAIYMIAEKAAQMVSDKYSSE
jgi:choline dehydrogenase-like flavoprotein